MLLISIHLKQIIGGAVPPPIFSLGGQLPPLPPLWIRPWHKLMGSFLFVIQKFR